MRKEVRTTKLGYVNLKDGLNLKQYLIYRQLYCTVFVLDGL